MLFDLVDEFRRKVMMVNVDGAGRPAGGLPAGCIDVCAQPERNAADTAAVLPANFRKSRLEIVDDSLPMAYLLSRFRERVNTNCFA